MTMANGIELRVPFLDHKLVEFAATLPQHCKLGGKGGKTLLRKAVRGLVPDVIIDRPKKGFPIPIASWLRTPLRQFTRENLLARSSACNRYFNHSAVARIVGEHEQGRADRSQEIWALLVFEFWHQQFISNCIPSIGARGNARLTAGIGVNPGVLSC
jgi:asparagine synthase (glutamine-hydrolysing)